MHLFNLPLEGKTETVSTQLSPLPLHHHTGSLTVWGCSRSLKPQVLTAHTLIDCTGRQCYFTFTHKNLYHKYIALWNSMMAFPKKYLTASFLI